MTRFFVGAFVGALLGYMAAVAPLNQAKQEAKRARAQVSLYYCIAADLEDIIQDDHPEWHWWNEATKPQVDCDKVFDYFYEQNRHPAEAAWLDVGP